MACVSGSKRTSPLAVVIQNSPVPMEMVGVRDEFGEVGTEGYLKERFGLTAAVIAEKARAVLARKK